MSIKALIQQRAYELGADLVGFGDIGRCKHAPLMMSPQGLYPKAKTVVVMAVKHPDGCIDLGGERHPQEIGPYTMQYHMNSRLDEMSYRLATFIENLGYGTVPIASSNIWRYNEYKELKAVFAPDVSHIYMAVVAGLADMGYSGLALTPEYGARNRFITVITEAEIEPDPLIPPGTVCDRCMLCRQHCPSGALTKEIHGDHVLKIEPYEYRFANKNLWRCAWGEHFDLDLDLPIPDKVDEALIVDMVKQHGIRCGEMGQCLKFCLSKRVRSFDRSYSSSPVRRHHVSWDESLEPRTVASRLGADAQARGADAFFCWSGADLAAAGIDLAAALPGARSAVGVGIIYRPVAGNQAAAETGGQFWHGARHTTDSICYDTHRRLEEMGFTSLTTLEGSTGDGTSPLTTARAKLTALATRTLGLDPAQEQLIFNVVLTRKSLPSLHPVSATVATPTRRVPGHETLNELVTRLAKDYGADLVGYSSAGRLDSIVSQVRPLFDGQEELVAIDRSHRFKSWEPEITVVKRTLRTTQDYLPGAKSVLVLGFRFHKEVVAQAGKPPAEAVGPYAFETYATAWMGAIVGMRLVKLLESLGHQAVIAPDLSHSGSLVGNPRGPQQDLFSNRFEAVAAGLGHMTLEGRVTTPQFGLRQRFVAIVTDAEFAPATLSAPRPGEVRCGTCADKPCFAACPSQAYTDRTVSFVCEGIPSAFRQVDRQKCDWCERYGLMAREGFGCLGSTVNVPPGAEVTPAKLDAALRQLDPIKKYRPVTAEPCLLACPHAR